jgi:hypothetical protein
MNVKHIFKAAMGLTILFLGFQFGRDIANKVNSTGTATPAA